MMRCVGIAMLLMVMATVSVHLGLPEAIAQVVMKVCKCHKCLSFWITLLGLLASGCPIVYAALLSILAAYLSNWVALILTTVYNIYKDIWQKLNE